MPVPGPIALARGVVVAAGDDVPSAWAGAPVREVDEAALASPEAMVSALHDAWMHRRPVVIRLLVEADRVRTPESVAGDVWRLSPRLELWNDRLHFLLWANTYDARDGIEPVWWWGRKAARLGAVEGGGADVVLADGRPAWVDGGPRRPFDADTLDGAVVVHREVVDLGHLRPDPPPRPVRAELAPDQLEAVAHGSGPARIVAPAGSGKTRVLTERLRHLVVDRGFDRESVLAVAYNKRAQLELEGRTADFAPRVATLNALGHQLLGRPRVLDEREVRRIIDELVPPRQRRANTDPIAPYLEGLSAIRLGLRDPEEVEAERDDVPGLSAAFDPYRAALRRARAVDFDEQIYAAVELLLADGEFRRRTQQAHRHLLVDELQDLTPAHVLLVRLLAAPGLEVFGVGDDDQVIYGHAGADPAFLIDFAQLFPGATDHPLQVNYRCPVAVVDAARHLLGYNRRRVPKEIHAGPLADDHPSALVVERHPPELGASTMTARVRAWLDEDVEPAAIAVLTRVNSLLLAPHVALTEAGVPLSSTLPTDVLSRTGMRAALAYLRLGAAPDRMQPDDLQEVLRRPSRGFPNWIGKWMSRTMSLGDIRSLPDRIDDAKVGMKLADFAEDLTRVAAAVAAPGATTRSVLAVIADDVGLAGAMSMLDGSKGGQSGSQLDDLDALAQVADLHPTPATFETWLRGVLAKRGREGGVTLSTVHRVKGMEWDRVVVAGVTDGVLPHRLSENEEEERRVLHVAITRGRHRVAVLADVTRPSPFLGELDGTAPVRVARTLTTRPTEVTPIPKRERGAKAPLGDPSSPEAAAAEEALRAWRTERARTDGMPAYIVASNALIRAIAERRPSSAKDLFAVHGMGPSKLELYGDEILAILDSLSPSPNTRGA
ncbi:MAG TPA: ATP-dependent DNA helicase UvrD2 [Acidimicrobiales bacterium]|nr:ATP-dependent DNA helicase UvrD2 [Acidimicrobiales bacterium]